MLHDEIELSNSPFDFTELLILAVSFEKLLLEKKSRKTKSDDYLSAVKSTIKNTIYHNGNYKEVFEDDVAVDEKTLNMLDDYTSQLLHNITIDVEKASANFHNYMKELEEEEGSQSLYSAKYEVTNWVNLFTWIVIESADSLEIEVNKETFKAKLKMKKMGDIFEFYFDNILEAHKGLLKHQYVRFNGKEVKIDYTNHKIFPFLAVMASALVESVIDNPEDLVADKPEKERGNKVILPSTAIVSDIIQ